MMQKKDIAIAVFICMQVIVPTVKTLDQNLLGKKDLYLYYLTVVKISYHLKTFIISQKKEDHLLKV